MFSIVNRWLLIPPTYLPVSPICMLFPSFFLVLTTLMLISLLRFQHLLFLFWTFLCSFPPLLPPLLPYWNTVHECVDFYGVGDNLFVPCFCLFPDSQPGYPLCLWSAIESILGKQQQYWLQCASWLETLPYKALGTVAQANFFFPFLQNKPVSLLSTSSGETVRPHCGLFLVFAPLQWRRPCVC